MSFSANFVIIFFAAGFGRAIAMLFLDFVEQFDSTVTTTSISFALQMVSISLASMLVTSLLVPVTGERVAITIGSLGNSLCTIFIGMSPNVGVFMMLMTAKGICLGVTFVPAISMISQYFVRRRSLATALANCGISVGNMAAPPLVRALVEAYGLRGTFIIFGALQLHTVAAALLMRPLSQYSAVVNPASVEKRKESSVPLADATNTVEEVHDTMDPDTEQSNATATSRLAATPPENVRTFRQSSVLQNKEKEEESEEEKNEEDGRGGVNGGIKESLLLPSSQGHEEIVTSKDTLRVDSKGQDFPQGRNPIDKTRLHMSRRSPCQVQKMHLSKERLDIANRDVCQQISESPYEDSELMAEKAGSLEGAVDVFGSDCSDLSCRSQVKGSLLVSLEGPRLRSASANEELSIQRCLRSAALVSPSGTRPARPPFVRQLSVDSSVKPNAKHQLASLNFQANGSKGHNELRIPEHGVSIHINHETSLLENGRNRSSAGSRPDMAEIQSSREIIPVQRVSLPVFKSSSWSIVSAPLGDLAVDVEVCAMESQSRIQMTGNSAAVGSVTVDEILSPHYPKPTLWQRTKGIFQETFNLKLLKSWALRTLLLSSVTGILIQYVVTYLPTIAAKQGKIGAEPVSLLLTVGGAVDLGSRIAIGAFTDTHLLKPTQIVAITQLIMGKEDLYNVVYCIKSKKEKEREREREREREGERETERQRERDRERKI
ncbi:uncharacterized protein LOC106012764 [Aplysia californica]|uniref:Uncharacterized protein LOC106012764 n=1 Tax=Aplysia californica TaxID=6500 RepID=A0ABM1A713_APLCA|nr:uncharacterized protein LOC106012764 [Aplysia californica]